MPTKAGLFGLVFTALLIGIGLTGLAARVDYMATKRNEFTEVRSAATLVSEHAVGVLSAAEQMAERIRDLVGGRDPAGLRNSRVTWENLRRIAAGNPYLTVLLVIDARGDIVLTTARFPAPPANVADRPYFHEHRAGAESHIGETLRGRTTNQLVFTLSHRLAAPDGSFAGVAVVGLNTDYFLEVYRNANPRGSASASIVGQDGRLILRYPLDEATLGVSVRDAPLFSRHLPRASTGEYEGPSLLDRRDRIVAYRSLPEFPLVAVAAVLPDDAFADWRSRTVWRLVTVSAGILVLCGFAWLALRGLHGERLAHAEVADSNRRLTAALADKDVLFREVHHRVKNNLQIVSNLLLLQSARLADPQARAALTETLDRVQSIALVHRVLYQTNQPARVDLAHYLRDLCASLDAALAGGRGIAVTVEGAPVLVDLGTAIPIALIVNEAVSNAFKHAFPEGGGRIAVSVVQAGTDILVEVRDDGVGIAPGAPSAGGIGMELIRSLAEQLGATLAFHADGGTLFRLTVPCRDEGQPSLT